MIDYVDLDTDTSVSIWKCNACGREFYFDPYPVPAPLTPTVIPKHCPVCGEENEKSKVET